MKTKNKVTMLTLAMLACSIGGFVASPKAVASANANESAFYMEAGAQVNIKDETYGGIRWATVIEEGYVPVAGATAQDVVFGTFVVPTKTYENEKSTKEIKDMVDVVDVVSDVTGADAQDSDVVYYSAIKYDDIIADYMATNNLSSLTDAQETALLTQAYQMELTAISYALYNDTYYYATATETSRSARQVANMAILSKELEKEGAGEEKISQIKSYVETGADNFARTSLTNENEGYLDLSELSASEVVAQPIDVSEFGIDFANDVAEILVGANKLTADDYTYESDTLSLKKGSALLEAGKETWLSIFTKNGNVYSLPVIPADGVIRTAQDLNDVFGMKNTAKYAATDPWEEIPLLGYYVLANDINGNGNGGTFNMTGDMNGGTTGIETVVEKQLGGFWGTFDGRGHIISNIASRQNGIFGWIVNATIKDVAFKSITSVSNISNANTLLARFAYNTTFENVYIDMEFTKSNGNCVLGYARSSTFENFVLNVNKYTAKNASSARSWGMFGLAQTWTATTGEYGADNTFTNTYMISDCMVAEWLRTGSGDTETIGTCVDGANWDEPTVGTSKNYKENQIKRYLDETDMFNNVYYSYDDNGTVVKSTDTSENDWTAFENSGYWTVDTANKKISWR